MNYGYIEYERLYRDQIIDLTNCSDCGSIKGARCYGRRGPRKSSHFCRAVDFSRLGGSPSIKLATEIRTGGSVESKKIEH